MRNLIALLLLSLCASFAAVPGETVIIGAGSDRELTARYFLPDGRGPFPAVVILHGSGGLWANDNPAAGVMVRHFEDWAQTLGAEGYCSLFVDSFTPRGLVEFRNRRPAEDPAVDDSFCSPAYERPKDSYKALAYLQSLPEIIDDRIALMGFSHGAETALASVVSTTLERTDWTMSYLKLDGSTETRSFPAPVRWQGAARFATVIAYYPGCGFYGYFGSPNATDANLYMPYAPTLMLHGGDDPLYSENEYPEKLYFKANNHANHLQLGHRMMQFNLYPGATHSFDEAPPVVAGQPETPNQTAKHLAQGEVLKWLRAHLQPARLQVFYDLQIARPIQFWLAPIGSTQTIFSGADPATITTTEETRLADILEQTFVPAAIAPHRFYRASTQIRLIP